MTKVTYFGEFEGKSVKKVVNIKASDFRNTGNKTYTGLAVVLEQQVNIRSYIKDDLSNNFVDKEVKKLLSDPIVLDLKEQA